MNALGITMVKNEADIIEAFVRHNLHYVDLLVVIDNGSTDGTRAILDALRGEGLPLLIVEDPIFGYHQSEKMTHVYRKVVPIYNPDLVYLLDADEFIRAAGRDQLEAVLGELAPGSMALLPWVTHLPPEHPDAERLADDPLGCMRARRRQEEPVYYKAVIRRDSALDHRLVIEQGNHAVKRSDGLPVPAALLKGAAVAHLPVRSVEQLSAKVINGWHAYLVRNRVQAAADMGYQWKQLYEQILCGQTLTPAMLLDVALGYAQQARPGRSAVRDTVDDPTTPLYGRLCYRHLGHNGVLAKVARNMESFLLGDTVPAPAGHGRACDLAPLLDLIRQTGARSLMAQGASAAWLDELRPLLPGVDCATENLPDVLLVAGLASEDVARLTRQGAPAARRIVYWPSQSRVGPALDGEMQDWANAGWQPMLMDTMAYRALSSYALQRRHAIVLQPTPAGSEKRASLVRSLLCALDGQPSAWTDPAAQCIRHPMQDLRLEALAGA